MNAHSAVKQLQRSERGAAAQQMLLEFLKSNTVKFLDAPNSEAIAFLATKYLMGTSSDACEVIEALEQNLWTQESPIAVK